MINKSVNYYQHYVDGKKVIDKQTKGDNWAIRKSLHKEFVYAKVNLVRIKVSRGKFITAIRKKLDTSFDLKTIDKITDTGIQKILKNYLSYKKSPELAFSPEGIEDLNNNIEKFNDGKKRQPIHKVRIFEIGSRFPLGETGNKKSKYVEAAKGTNLFFAIYVDEEGNRSYETIPLNIVIERLKQGLTDVPEINEKGDKLLFHLSPNDLVYVPTEEENAKPLDREELHQNRIYKMVSSSGSQCFFIKSEVANSIVNKIEYSALNKMERAIDGTMIKQVCIKLKVDRLGKVEEAFR